MDALISGRGSSARAPLAVKREAAERRPLLLSSFIDNDAPPNAVTSAKKSTSFLFDVAADLTIPKYVVARGSAEALENLHLLYDPRGVTVLDANAPELLIDDATTVIHDLVGHR